MKWEFNRRIDRNGLIEYVCECGVGHPVYASALWIAESVHGADHPDIDKMATAEMTHGCCGCCSRDDFPGDMVTSLKKSHEIIRDHIYKLHNEGILIKELLLDRLSEISTEAILCYGDIDNCECDVRIVEWSEIEKLLGKKNDS